MCEISLNVLNSQKTKKEKFVKKHTPYFRPEQIADETRGA